MSLTSWILGRPSSTSLGSSSANWSTGWVLQSLYEAMSLRFLPLLAKARR